MDSSCAEDVTSRHHSCMPRSRKLPKTFLRRMRSLLIGSNKLQNIPDHSFHSPEKCHEKDCSVNMNPQQADCNFISPPAPTQTTPFKSESVPLEDSWKFPHIGDINGVVQSADSSSDDLDQWPDLKVKMGSVTAPMASRRRRAPRNGRSRRPVNESHLEEPWFRLPENQASSRWINSRRISGDQREGTTTTGDSRWEEGLAGNGGLQAARPSSANALTEQSSSLSQSSLHKILSLNLSSVHGYAKDVAPSVFSPSTAPGKRISAVSEDLDEAKVSGDQAQLQLSGTATHELLHLEDGPKDKDQPPLLFTEGLSKPFSEVLSTEAPPSEATFLTAPSFQEPAETAKPASQADLPSKDGSPRAGSKPPSSEMKASSGNHTPRQCAQATSRKSIVPLTRPQRGTSNKTSRPGPLAKAPADHHPDQVYQALLEEQRRIQQVLADHARVLQHLGEHLQHLHQEGAARGARGEEDRTSQEAAHGGLHSTGHLNAVQDSRARRQARNLSRRLEELVVLEESEWEKQEILRQAAKKMNEAEQILDGFESEVHLSKVKKLLAEGKKICMHKRGPGVRMSLRGSRRIENGSSRSSSRRSCEASFGERDGLLGWVEESTEQSFRRQDGWVHQTNQQSSELSEGSHGSSFGFSDGRMLSRSQQLARELHSKRALLEEYELDISAGIRKMEKMSRGYASASGYRTRRGKRAAGPDA